jgi:HAD superfamily hydrolase (TIGR01549 family)
MSAPFAALQRLSQASCVARASRSRTATAAAAGRAATMATASSSEGAVKSNKGVLRGAVFDMDGTLTVPNLDFAEMYRRVGCKTNDILGEIDGWPEDRQNKANEVIYEMEQEALRTMKRMPGAEELGKFFDDKKLPRGLVTRNVQTSVAHFHANAWPLPPFTPALAREFKPYKPAPDALLHICERWGLDPSEVVMIGDSAKDDIVSGNRARAVTVLLDTEGKWTMGEGTGAGGGGGDGTAAGAGVTTDNGIAVATKLEGEMIPTFIVSSLAEVAPLLERHFEFVAPGAAAAPAPAEEAMAI